MFNIVTNWQVLDEVQEMSLLLAEFDRTLSTPGGDRMLVEEIRATLERLGKLLGFSAPEVLDRLQRAGDLSDRKTSAMLQDWAEDAARHRALQELRREGG